MIGHAERLVGSPDAADERYLMTDESIFRRLLLLGIGVMTVVGAFYRIRSQMTGEKLDRRQEGLFILLASRLAGFATMIGLIFYLIDPKWMAWSSIPAPAWVRWIGVVIGAGGALLMTWTLHCLGRNLTDTVVTRKEHTLVISGPYRWARHPFYSTFLIGLLGVVLMSANGYLAVTGGIVFALLVIRTRTEEQKLVERFGDEYRQYMRSTGRFFPGRFSAHP